MKNFIHFISLFFILLLTFVACKKIEPLEVSDIQSVKILKLTKQTLLLEVSVLIKNPNAIKFTIKDYDFDVFINQHGIGKAVIKDNIIIPKRSDELYAFNCEVNYLRLLASAIPIVKAIMMNEKVKIKVSGFMKVKAFGITSRHEIEIQKELRIGR